MIRRLVPPGLALLLGWIMLLPAVGMAAFLLPAPALAQEQEGTILPDYTLWESVARRAEEAIGAGRASDSALDQLRSELADWRARFLAAQSVNEARIATLRRQIEALGPVPEGESGEAGEIAARRQLLETQLAALLTPVRRAEEAYSQADGLIAEIDRLIRDRQAARFLELTPSPLNPVLWSQALEEAGDTFRALASELGFALSSSTGRIVLRENLPLTLGYLLAAGLLLLRGRSWVERLAARLRGDGAAGALRGFVLSLGQIALPVAGLLALRQALAGSGLLGFRGQMVADGLVLAFVALFAARWLALRLCGEGAGTPGFLQLGPQAAARMRRGAGALGFLWGAERLLGELGGYQGYSEAARIVLEFPLVLLAGLLLLQGGRLLRRAVRPAVDSAAADVPAAAGTGGDGAAEWRLRERGADLLARALMAVGVLAPLAAAVGYTTAGPAVIFPAILTLGLIAFLIILSGVIRDAYAVLSGADEARARDALLPVVLSMGASLGALPLFALIWGARVSDLTEIWTRFLEGFQIGDTRISPADFLTFVVVFAIGYVLTRLLQSTLRNSILPKTKIDPGARSAINSGIGYLGIFLAALVAISAAGIDLSSLAIVAGALSVGIGFGLQNVVSNFVSGIILLIERPITEGDWIEVGGQMGTVRDISVRSTRIETFDRYDVIIPNADLVSGAVVNYTRQNLIGRTIVRVGVAYGTDTRRVEAILREIAEAHPMVLLKPPPGVHFVGFGADSLDFEIRLILRDVNFALSVRSDVHHEIARRFAEEGIEIPFAQRDIWLRNPESLHAGGPERGAAGSASAAGSGAGDMPAARPPAESGQG